MGRGSIDTPSNPFWLGGFPFLFGESGRNERQQSIEIQAQLSGEADWTIRASVPHSLALNGTFIYVLGVSFFFGGSPC